MPTINKEILAQTMGTFSDVGERLWEEKCFRVSASLSYATLIAIVPQVMVMVSILALFPVFDEWTIVVKGFIFENLVPATGNAVNIHLEKFSENIEELTAIGVGFLLISSLLLFATVEETFNDIWKIEQQRHWAQRISIYTLLLLLGPVLVVASLSLSSTLLSVSLIQNQIVKLGLDIENLWYLPALLELIGLFLFYTIVPNTKISALNALIGSLTSVILFEMAKVFFSVYISNFDSYQIVYGALAVLPLFLLWIYISWLVVLTGAIVTAVLGEQQQKTLFEAD